MKKLLILISAVIWLTACTQTDLITNQVDNTNGLETGSTTVVVGSTLSKLLISDVFDDQGTVAENKTSFSATTPEIGVSAYILGAKTGLKVTAELTYLPSGDKVGPVANDTQMEGDIISSFSFSKPTKDWPSGNYAVTATLADGQTLTTNFIVP